MNNGSFLDSVAVRFRFFLILNFSVDLNGIVMALDLRCMGEIVGIDFGSFFGYDFSMVVEGDNHMTNDLVYHSYSILQNAYHCCCSSIG